MTVSQGCPKPILEFIEAGWDQNVMRVIKKNGFIKPTPIQVSLAIKGYFLNFPGPLGSGRNKIDII